jgi:hypothetical protein
VITTTRQGLAFVLALTAAPAAAVEHTALACVPADRYARITAHAEAASVVLQFRTSPGVPWYSTRMAGADGEWTAFLPRPAISLREVEYRFVVTDAGAKSSPTDPVRARVGAPGECDEAGRPSVDALIVVTVPEGAPVTPPVPAGFSPAGVVAAEARRRSSLPFTIAGLAAGVGVAGAVAGATAEATSAPPPSGPLAVPDIRFNSIDPPPGSTVSAARGRIAISMRLGARPAGALAFQWRAEILSEDGRLCMTMDGVAGVPEGLDLVLTAPIVIFGACGSTPPFDSQRMRITLRVNQDFVFDETLVLPYHFEP